MPAERFFILNPDMSVASGPHMQSKARALCEPMQKIVTRAQLDALKRRPGRPPAAGDKRQVPVSITMPPEYRDWLDRHGDRSEQIRKMIEQAMSEE